jgi:drug/metabolite transporter (DMT)-like permease
LIIATIPIVVLLLAFVLLRERIGPRGLLGIILSLLGVALLVTSGGDLGGSVLGDVLIFGAVVSAAFYMLFTRRLGANLSSLQITGMQVIFGAIIFFPAFLYELPDLRWREVGGDALLAVGALAVFATIGAFLCYNYALTKIPASSAAVCINGIPLVTAGASWLLLGEILSPLQLLGGTVVLLGVFLAHQRPTAFKGTT